MVEANKLRMQVQSQTQSSGVEVLSAHRRKRARSNFNARHDLLDEPVGLPNLTLCTATQLP